MNTRALVAEFVGPFALIFIGAEAVAVGVGAKSVRPLPTVYLSWLSHLPTVDFLEPI